MQLNDTSLQIMKTLIGSALLAVVFTAGGNSAQMYKLTDLGISHDPNWYAGTFDINNSGVVVGTQGHAPFNSSSGERAVMWTPGAGVQDLGTLGGDFSFGSGINDAGQVVGYSRVAGLNDYHGFVWSADQGMQDIGTPTGFSSRLVDINNSGLAAGMAHYNGGGGFVVNIGEPTTFIDPLHFVITTGINATGVVSGYFNAQALIWSQDDGITFLAPPNSITQAYGINDSGFVAGRSVHDAVVWDPTGSMSLIGRGIARDINGHGQVIGERDERPFLWEEGIGQQRLSITDPSIGRLLNVDAINDVGQIVGLMWAHGGDNFRAVLLTPTDDILEADVTTSMDWTPVQNVPEGGQSIVLVGVAIAAMFCYRNVRPRRPVKREIQQLSMIFSRLRTCCGIAHIFSALVGRLMTANLARRHICEPTSATARTWLIKASLLAALSLSGVLQASPYTVNLVDASSYHWDEYLYKYTPGQGWAGINTSGNDGTSIALLEVIATDGTSGQLVDLEMVFEVYWRSYFFYDYGVTPEHAENFAGIGESQLSGSVTAYNHHLTEGGWGTGVEEPSLTTGRYLTTVVRPYIVGPFIYPPEGDHYLVHSSHTHFIPEGLEVWDPTKPAEFAIYGEVGIKLIRAEVVNVAEGGTTMAFLCAALVAVFNIRSRTRIKTCG